MADKPSACTFASNTAITYSPINRSGTESLSSSADNEDPVSTPDTKVHHYTQLSRRKSIHKRIGRIFLRISRMCSDAQCNAYAYQYGSEACELPAGESPIEGSTPFYEMPGSFPRAELEQPDLENSALPYYHIRMPHEQTAPEHLRDYYKANQNATLRRAAPLSVVNLPQSLRLEVPRTQHCVPRLISDNCSITPSPISPITPQDEYSTQSRNYNSQMHLSTVSPCTTSKQPQIYAHYGPWGHGAPQPPATPSTFGSYDSSNCTTPYSAHPSSARSAFDAWAQPQLGQLPPAYSQTCSPVEYNQSPNRAMALGASSWQVNVSLQPQHYENAFSVAQMQYQPPALPLESSYYESNSHAPSQCGKQNQQPSKQLQFTPPQQSHTNNEAPPAYTPVTPDLQPPAPNLQQRYPPSVCHQCGKVFTGKYGTGNCKRHVQQSHGSILDRVTHMCKVCMKTYNRADALRKHQWKKHRLEGSRPSKRRR